ncbi:MAG: hypothetical protein JSV33_01310 [bacterium]|nr:MAG: hypothetical protein JSV33_01310 [bacterium]
MSKIVLAMLFVAVLAITSADLAAFPLGISVKGGIGLGYYSMDALNDNLRIASQQTGAFFDDLSKGINVALQGRVWFLGRYGVHLGYQHYWGESSAASGGLEYTYKTPADVYAIGGVLNILSFPVLFDINAGANWCHVRSIFGTNVRTTSFLQEYKGNDNGFELYAEVVTNFVRPVDIGIQFGYRGLTVKSLENKFKEEARFPISETKVELEYSGVFFFFTAGIRL